VTAIIKLRKLVTVEEITLKMYCEVSVGLKQVVPQHVPQQYCHKIDTKRPIAILAQYKITNSFAFNSLYRLIKLKLLKTVQSNTIIKAGINSINLIRTKFTKIKYNVLNQKRIFEDVSPSELIYLWITLEIIRHENIKGSE